jgi:formylglycine-generating enzyme required for sulfatase activity
VNGQPTNSGQVQTIVLSGPGTNTVTNIVVTAPNGAQKTYAVEVSRAVKVEPEPERLEPTMASAVDWDSPSGSFSSQGETKFSGVSQESAQAGDDRPSEATGPAPSTESFPYLSIGLGILAVLGALVYFVVFSQGPSPEPRAAVPYQSTVQPPTTRPEVSTPPPAPAPITQPSAATTQEKRTVKKATNTGEAVVTKPRPVAEVGKTITGKDGAPMVLIPAGSFQMGSTKDEVDRAIHTCLTEYKKDQQTCEGWFKRELPQHRVQLDAFYLDQYEVTTARYAKFFKETNRRQPVYWSANVVSAHASKPVVGVDWNDATAYCAWAGRRLPTEAEWEKAARGTDQRSYPWGNEAPSEQRANFNHCCDFNEYGALTDVGLFEQGRSPSGAYDMAGNVWEWTADWYDETYYGESPARNPTGPSSGDFRMLRGGSWDNGPVYVRSALRLRGTSTERGDNIGFRCAQDIPK